MSRISVRTSLPAIVSTLTLGIGCHNSLSPVNVVGSYSLSSTMGTIGRYETPVSGSLALTPDRVAERRVSYYRDTTTAVTEFVALGTYQTIDSTVFLALREDSGRSAYVWRVTATFDNSGLLRLTYPRPADGTVVEIYQRR